MILVTGAAGFIGSYLLNALVERYGKDKVLALTSKPITGYNYLLHADYSFGNDYFEVNGWGDKIETIIHAGAFTPKTASEGNNWKQCNKNIFTTGKLIEAKLPNLKKVIYLSTLDVYGKSEVISEDSDTDPISLYGYSKLYSEKLLQAWANLNNKVCHVLRVGHVYGPGEESYQKLIPVVISKIINDEVVEIWGKGDDKRSFIYIDDLVNAILKAVEINEDVGVVNLVSGQSVSIKTLIEMLISISQKKVNITEVTYNGPQRDLIFDNSKMLNLFAIEETDLTDGLKKEWAYMSSLN